MSSSSSAHTSSALRWRLPVRLRPSHPRWSALVALSSHCSFFRSLPPMLVRRLLSRMALHYLPLESFVTRLGDRSAFLALVLRGELAVLSPERPGGTTDLAAVASLVPGDSFGAQSLLDGAPRSAAVLTQLECELAVLTRRDYLQVIASRYDSEADLEAKAEEEDAAADDSGAAGESDPELLSLLDPGFAAQSSLPVGFELNPHLQHYIRILTERQRRDEERRERSRATLGTASLAGLMAATAPLLHGAAAGTLTAAAAGSSASAVAAASIPVLALPSPPTEEDESDTSFLINLLRTAKVLQTHDRRPVLAGLAKHLSLHHYPAHTVLYEKGSLATYSYFILSGSVAEMRCKSNASLAALRAARRERRASVRAVLAQWELAERRESEAALKQRAHRPHYMNTTTQIENAKRDNAQLLANVAVSAAVLEKEADRALRAQQTQGWKQERVAQLLREAGLESIDSSEDEDAAEEAAARAALAQSSDGAPLTCSSSSSSQAHQFPNRSCLAVYLYPDSCGWSDWDVCLRQLQRERLEAHQRQSLAVDARERERATLVAAAHAAALSSGGLPLTAAQALAQANQILEHREKERADAAMTAAALEEVEAAAAAAAGTRGRKRSPTRGSAARDSASSASFSASSSDLTSFPGVVSRILRERASLERPVYLSPQFATVTHSRTLVTREPCFVLRLPNFAMLEALEAPYHGPLVTEKLNDPALRFTVLRQQEGAQGSALNFAKDDPDAELARAGAAAAAKLRGDAVVADAAADEDAPAASVDPALVSAPVRIDYAPHIERLFNSMQHLRFFSIQNRELGLKLCAKMKYLSLDAGDVLCKQGEFGTMFFLLASGTISIHIKPHFHLPQLQQTLAAQEAKRVARGNRQRRGGIKKLKNTVTAAGALSAPNQAPPKAAASGAAPPLQPAGSVMVQSLLFPTTSPIDQMKQQEREQKDGDAKAAAGSASTNAAGTGPSAGPVPGSSPPPLNKRASVASNQQGSVMIQSLMFPTTSPVQQMRQQEREQLEGEERERLRKLGGGGGKGGSSGLNVQSSKSLRFLQSFDVDLKKLLNPPSLVSAHLSAPHSNIERLVHVDSLYGPSVHVAVSGAPIGESSLVSGNPRSATCIAREPCELFTLSQADYRAIYATPQHLKLHTIIHLLNKGADEIEMLGRSASAAAAAAAGADDEAPSLSLKDLQLLEQCIQDIEFFKPLHASIRSIVAQRLHHLQLPAGHVVFEQGRPGQYLYILISGSASVYVKPPAPPVAPQPVASSTAVVVAAPLPPPPPASRLASVVAPQGPTSISISPAAESADSKPSASAIDEDVDAEVAALAPLSAPENPMHSRASSLDAPETLSRRDLTPSPPLESGRRSGSATAGGSISTRHRRSHRTSSMTKASAKAILGATSRHGAEMLSPSKGASFNFSSSATLGAAAGGGRAFSAGKIKPSQLARYPPATSINLADQDADYLNNLGPVSSIISVGGSFGESALSLNGPGLHSSTVVTNSSVDLLLLTRASYEFCLASLQQWKRDLDEVLSFLRSSHFFHNWSPTLLSKAMNLMERREIKRGEVVCAQGARATHIFFIMQGEVVSTQNCVLVDKELPRIPDKKRRAHERKRREQEQSEAIRAAEQNKAARKAQREKEREASANKAFVIGGARAAATALAAGDRPQPGSLAALVGAEGPPLGSLQFILREQHWEEEQQAAKEARKPAAAIAAAEDDPAAAAAANLAASIAFPLRTRNGLVSSLITPQFGLPLCVPTLTKEEPVPLMTAMGLGQVSVGGSASAGGGSSASAATGASATGGLISNFSNLLTGSQTVDGLDPHTPIVEGGQIWLFWPQKLGQSAVQVSSGCKRRYVKRIYKAPASNNAANLGQSGSAAAAAAPKPSASDLSASPVFPFNLHLSTLSRHGICGALETLLPTVLGVRELLGRPETDEEKERAALKREAEASAIEALAQEAGGVPAHALPSAAAAAAAAAAAVPDSGRDSPVPGSSPGGAQCQLAYPATFTASTDCTLVCFPVASFHALLSLTEETQFLSLHTERLRKSSALIRKYLEGRFLSDRSRFPRELLDDFRCFEENLYFARKQHVACKEKEVCTRDTINAMARPGVKPPAAMDFRTEAQVRELHAAGLGHLAYTLELEARQQKQKEASSNSTSSLPTHSGRGGLESEHLSFSVTGMQADARYSAAIARAYIPTTAVVGSDAGKPKATKSRAILDTIASVSQANSLAANATQAVAASTGRAVFDPMRAGVEGSLPMRAEHTPEFAAAVRYADLQTQQRKLKSSQQQQNQEAAAERDRQYDSPERQMAHSQSLPAIMPAGSHSQLHSPAMHSSSPSPSFFLTSVAGSTPVSPTQQARRVSQHSTALTPLQSRPADGAAAGFETPTPDSASQHQLAPRMESPQNLSLAALSSPTHPSLAALVAAPSTPAPVLSPLASSAQTEKFFSRSPAGAARTPGSAAGMVSHLLADAPHELERFLSHVSKQHQIAAASQVIDEGRGLTEKPRASVSKIKARRKKHKHLLRLGEDTPPATDDAAADVAENDPSSPSLSGSSGTVMSGPQYALTSAVLALQTKSAQAQALHKIQVEFARSVHAQRIERAEDNSRAQRRRIAKALCLPDPHGAERGADFSQNHIKHLQRVRRTEEPQTNEQLRNMLRESHSMPAIHIQSATSPSKPRHNATIAAAIAAGRDEAKSPMPSPSRGGKQQQPQQQSALSLLDAAPLAGWDAASASSPQVPLQTLSGASSQARHRPLASEAKSPGSSPKLPPHGPSATLSSQHARASAASAGSPAPQSVGSFGSTQRPPLPATLTPASLADPAAMSLQRPLATASAAGAAHPYSAADDHPTLLRPVHFASPPSAPAAYSAHAASTAKLVPAHPLARLSAASSSASSLAPASAVPVPALRGGFRVPQTKTVQGQ